MRDIRHRVGIAAPQHRVYEMVSTRNGLEGGAFTVAPDHETRISGSWR